MSKRTNSIVAVTIAQYATVYVEADTPKEAAEIVKNNIDEIYDAMPDEIDEDFQDSEIEVASYNSYTTGLEDYMERIWADGEVKTLDEYMEELYGEEGN